MTELHNEFLHFSCDPENGSFDLTPVGDQRQDLPRVKAAWLGIRYVDNRKQRICRWDSWTPVNQFAESHPDSKLGPLKTIEFKIKSDSNLATRILFGLPEFSPFLIWKVEIQDLGDSPLNIDQIDMLTIGRAGEVNQGSLFFPGMEKIDHLAFHSQGWQSWSWTATYGVHEGERRSRLKWIQSPLYANPGTPQPRQPRDYAADFYGILGDRSQRTALLAGFLSQREQFGTIKVDINEHPNLAVWANCDQVRLDAGASLSTDWAVLMPFHVDVPEELDVFFKAAAKENAVREMRNIPAGWCSWYEFYQKISEEKIEQNLAAIESLSDKLPLGLVQIDDGFEHEVGDWLTFREGFPNGVKPLAQQISMAGYQPGLWLAPFIVHPKADIYHEKPDWLLRNRAGRPVNAGFIWDVFTTALDLTHPEAMDYVCEVIRTAVQDWGFTYLKLDFLYAAVVDGKYRDPKLTRAQVLRKAFERIRAAAGAETMLLACGCPIGSALGLFDAMRIGADVSGSWKPAYGGLDFLFTTEPNMPSARNAIQNVLTRAPMHLNWFVNDPDCLIVRESSQLTLEEIRSLATVIAVSGGSLLLSDNLPGLSQERLEIARALIPSSSHRPVVLDWFDRVSPERVRVDFEGPEGKWSVAAIFNWQDAPQRVTVTREDLRLTAGKVICRSFWDDRVQLREENQLLFADELPAHSCALLAIREIEQDIPRYAGSSVHFSQGLEVKEWRVEGNKLSARLDVERVFGGTIEFWLPAEIKSASWSGIPLAPSRQTSNLVQFHLPEGNGGWFEIEWQ